MRDKLSSIGSYLVFLTESSLFQPSKFNSPPCKSNLPPVQAKNTKCLDYFNLKFSQLDRPKAVTVVVTAIATQLHNIANHEARHNSNGDRDYEYHVFATAAAAATAKQAEA